MKRNIAAMLLSVGMVLGSLPLAAFAAQAQTLTDAQESWAAESIDRWSGLGVLNGDDQGQFHPDKEMTRAEFSQMLVNLMGYTDEGDASFEDVPEGAWYESAIEKLAAAGVMEGTSATTASPEEPISREQAAVLLCRAMEIEPKTEETTTSFPDDGEISPWARSAVKALNERGMLNGTGNGLEPQVNINRASVAKLMDNMVSAYITPDGGEQAEGEQDGVVIVAAKDVEIKDATLKENLIVAPKAGEANVQLTGETKAEGTVVVAAPKASLTVEKTAQAKTVAASAPEVSVSVAGKVDQVETAGSAAGTTVEVAKGAEVSSLNVAAAGAKVAVAGSVGAVEIAKTASNAVVSTMTGAKVASVTTSAAGTSVKGAKNTVSTFTAKESASGANVETGGTKVSNLSLSSVSTGKNSQIASGSKGTVTASALPQSASTNSSGGGSSGGSDGGTSPAAESGTTITVSGDKKTINVDETITLKATSGGADVSGIQWSSDKGEIATVDETTGEVTGVKAGTATITATATVDNNMKGTFDITVEAIPLDSIIESVSIGGEFEVGKTLTATPKTKGNAVLKHADAIIYEWQQGDSASGTFTPIEGVTTNTFASTAAQHGKYIKVIVKPNVGSNIYSGENGIASAVSENPCKTPLDYSVTITNSSEGDAKFGDTLTAGVEVKDNEFVSDSTLEYSYQWYRSKDGTKTPMGTNNTYLLTAEDIDSTIEVTVTAGGNYTGSKTSVLAATIGKAPISGTVSITDGSAPEFKKTLTADITQVTVPVGKVADASLTYQWYRGATPITGATANTYELTADDIGQKMKVIVTAGEDGNYIGFVESQETAIVTAPIEGSVTIQRNGESTGSPKIGETLTADVSGITVNETTVNAVQNHFTYQWYSDNVDITGATANTYTLTPDDIGKAIKVKVIAKGNYTGDKTSAPTATVQALITGTVSITVDEDAPKFKEVLDVDLTGLAVTGGTVENAQEGLIYQWYRNNEKITGDAGTGSTYTVQAADIGSTIKVTVTAKEDGNYSGSLESNATAAVIQAPIAGTVTIQRNGVSLTEAPKFGEILEADISEFTVNGATADATVIDSSLTYQWYHGTIPITGAYNSQYKVEKADIGQEIWVKVTATGNYSSFIPSSKTMKVVKAEQLEPWVAFGGVGKITGLNPDTSKVYEYRPEPPEPTNEDEGWQGPITGVSEISNLSAGKYQIRFKGSDTHNPSNFIEVDVYASVTVASGIAHGSVSISPRGPSFKNGEQVTITVTPDTGYRLDHLNVTDSSGTEIPPKPSKENPEKHTFTVSKWDIVINAEFVATTKDISNTTFTIGIQTNPEDTADTRDATNPVIAKMGNTLEVNFSETQPESGIVSDLNSDKAEPKQLSYQWYRDGRAIEGAWTDTYTLVQEDIGKSIQVNASAVQGGKYTGSVMSKNSVKVNTSIQGKVIYHSKKEPGSITFTNTDNNPVDAFNGETVKVKVKTNPGYRLVEVKASSGTLTAGTSVSDNEMQYLLTVGTTDITVHATFEIINYTITYDLDGGVLAEGTSNPRLYNVESEPITLPQPTRDGYTFEGWKNKKDKESKTEKEIKIATGSSGDLEYTAQWTQEKYEIIIGNVTNLKCEPSGEGTAPHGDELTITLSKPEDKPDEFDLPDPDEVTVKIGTGDKEKPLSEANGDYAYNKETGVIVIKGEVITGDVTITAAGVPVYFISFQVNKPENGSVVIKENPLDIHRSRNSKGEYEYLIPDLPEVEVTPKSGCWFEGWQDEDKKFWKVGDSLGSGKNITLTPVIRSADPKLESDWNPKGDYMLPGSTKEVTLTWTSAAPGDKLDEVYSDKESVATVQIIPANETRSESDGSEGHQVTIRITAVSKGETTIIGTFQSGATAELGIANAAGSAGVQVSVCELDNSKKPTYALKKDDSGAVVTIPVIMPDDTEGEITKEVPKENIQYGEDKNPQSVTVSINGVDLESTLGNFTEELFSKITYTERTRFVDFNIYDDLTADGTLTITEKSDPDHPIDVPVTNGAGEKSIEGGKICSIAVNPPSLSESGLWVTIKVNPDSFPIELDIKWSTETRFAIQSFTIEKPTSSTE